MANNKQAGVVSFFIVIFTTLLLTVLVVGFLRIMIQDQKQATNQDLSQSAYDSAISGVEDAKRVLRACAQGSATACTAIAIVDPAEKCNTITKSGLILQNGASTETLIQSDGSTVDINQGYTCVFIEPNSPDYLGNVKEGKSQIVPLKVTAAAPDTIKTITIEWMHKDNGTSGSGYAGGDLDEIIQPTAAAGVTLPPKADWGTGGAARTGAPALLRVQAVLPAAPNAVNVDDLDTSTATTTFFRPSIISDVSNAAVTLPGLRASDTTQPSPTVATPKSVSCSNTAFLAGDYACKIVIDVSTKNVPTGSTVAFLRLSPLYRDTSFRVTVQGTVTPELVFDGVQPRVDSTGRAANIYRRVSSRLDMSSVIMPPAAISITGSLCKDFYVTDTASVSLGSCATDLAP